MIVICNDLTTVVHFRAPGFIKFIDEEWPWVWAAWVNKKRN